MRGKKHTLYVSHSTDPWLNLAIEDWIFQRIQPNEKALFVSRNTESIVIGRFQNPWIESNVDAMLEDGVPLLRRQSGGGTVYHDLGNTNYSFIAPKDLYDVDENYRVLLQGLADLDVNAVRTERNDLLVNGKKISGSAFKKTSSKILHHGTLLHHADLRRLKKYLRSTTEGIESKGIKSISSPVINMSEINAAVDHGAILDSVGGRFLQSANEDDGDPKTVTEQVVIQQEETLQNDSIRNTFDLYRSWEWTFGKTPPFTQRINWKNGTIAVDLKITARHCVVEDVDISISHSEDGAPIFFNLTEKWKGLRYRREDLRQVMDDILRQEKNFPLFFPGFCDWLTEQIYKS